MVKGNERRKLTGIEDTVNEGEVDGDEHKNGLLVEHNERPEEGAVNHALERPIRPFVFRVHLAVRYRVILPHFDRLAL